MVQTLEIPHAEGYPPIKVVLHAAYAALAAELREAKQECATLRATVERLKAPVSDEEEYSFSSGLAPTDVRQQTSILMDEHYRFCYRRGLNALIAARAKEPK